MYLAKFNYFIRSF